MRPRPVPAAAVLLVLLAGTADADVLLNECLADPDGADAGAEFVELHNPGPADVALDGVRLEAANGADGVWRTRWAAAPGTVLPAGGYLLVADEGWTGQARPDAEVRLDLQNGPDAVRLARDGDVLDLLGYGEPLAPELSEGAPAAAARGRSLARRPDGHDTDDNASDWEAATPTPGTANFRARLLTAAALHCEPPSLPRVRGAVALAVTVRNDGAEPWPPGSWRGRVGAGSHAGSWDGLAPGDATALAWSARPQAPGRLAVALEVEGAGGTVAVVPAGSLQVGPGDVILHEVMAAPADGQGEWVELAGLASVVLSGWTLRDADGGAAPLPDRALAAGDLVVLAADPQALLAREDAVAPPSACRPRAADVVAPPGWPALNNTAPDGRAWADRVLLVDPAGVVVDHVTVGPDGRAPAGRTVERVAARPVGAAWAVSTAPAGGTPGCPNSVASDGRTSDRLAAVPPVLDPGRGAGTVRLRFTAGEGTASWQLVLLDLWGAAVRTWGDDGLGPGPREILWSGEDDRGQRLPPGAYVGVLVARDGGGRAVRRDRALVVVR